MENNNGIHYDQGIHDDIQGGGIFNGITDKIKKSLKLLRTTCRQDFDVVAPQMVEKMNVLHQLCITYKAIAIQKNVPPTPEYNISLYPLGNPNDQTPGSYYKKIDIVYETYNFIVSYLDIYFSKINMNIGHPGNYKCKDFLEAAAYAHLLYCNPQIPRESYIRYVKNENFKRDVDDAFKFYNGPNNYRKIADIFYVKPGADFLYTHVVGSLTPNDEIVNVGMSFSDFIVRFTQSIDKLITELIELGKTLGLAQTIRL
uniref:Uncharacterized protein n=1 Tax=viral metagenome TaxID=1070528 RepID=A0A6C0BGL7_9ZZZZ